MDAAVVRLIRQSGCACPAKDVLFYGALQRMALSGDFINNATQLR
jgi:hypothetical protein